MRNTTEVHATAIVDEAAVLGDGVQVGAYSVIHAGVCIGKGSVIGSHCELGCDPVSGSSSDSLIIADNSLIRSHSVIYKGSQFGPNLNTGHRVTIREGVRAGRNLQVGTLGDIQGYCVIGDHVKMHSNVHIGHHSVIEDFVWLFPYVVLTNDPHPPSSVQQGVTVGKFAAVATMSVILPGVVVGQDALVGAHSSVSRDVPEGMVVVGSPAKVVCPASDIRLRDGTDRPAYPWRRHFHRGYPDAVVEAWRQEFDLA